MGDNYKAACDFVFRLFSLEGGKPSEPDCGFSIPFQRIEKEKLLFEKDGSFEVVETSSFGEEKTLSLFFRLLDGGVDFHSAAAALKLVNHSRAGSGNVLFVSVEEKKRVRVLLKKLSESAAYLGGNAEFAEGFETVFFIGEDPSGLKETKRLFLFKNEGEAKSVIKEKEYLIVLEER